MNKNELQVLKGLYANGLSMKKIAQKLGFSQHKVVYWMNKMHIARRSRSEANYKLYNPDGDPFKIKEISNNYENLLFGIGLGLYWGEGDKASKHQVRLTNTDPAMLRIFIKFLTELCGIKLSKIKYSIVCFNDSDKAQVEEFWSNELVVPLGSFGKIVQIPPQGKGTYKRKSKFGVCSATVSNVKFKAWILNELSSLRKN